MAEKKQRPKIAISQWTKNQLDNLFAGSIEYDARIKTLINFLPSDKIDILINLRNSMEVEKSK